MGFAWYMPFIKNLILNFCISYISVKSINYKLNNLEKISITIFNIVLAFIYSLLRKNIDAIVLYPIYYLVYIIFYSLILKINTAKTINIILFSISISIISMLISACTNYFLLSINFVNKKIYTIEEYIIAGIFQLIIIYLFFRIKRFKDGFSFFKNDKNFKIGITISIIIIIASVILGFFSTDLMSSIILIVLILGGLLMFDFIKKSITKFYKQNQRDKFIEQKDEEIKQKDAIIESLNNELKFALEINHKYSHRLSAMEKAVSGLGNCLSFNEEYAKEYGDVIDSLKDLSNEYRQELESLNSISSFPKTNIFSIDNLLEYMNVEAKKDNIDFELELNCDINGLINESIDKNKLEILLGDHIKDAIIAVNSSNDGLKKIKVVFDKVDNIYEIKFLDTGIEFEIDTLLKLGLEKVTTHALTGGSGIGFMTTFDTLKDCNASLVIVENNENDFKKEIIVKFDKLNQYVINSYRSKEISKQNKTNRIII